MTKSDEPLPSLDGLQRKIDQTRPESDKTPPSDTPPGALGNAMRLGTDLLAGVGVGGVLGYFLDRWLGTSPVCFIVFFFLGFAAGVRNILRNSDKIDG